jgi:carbamoyltransferase
MTSPILDQVILGINDSHDASAAIVHRGRILCAVAEERLQRVKSAGGFPLNAIKACLAEAGLDLADIDHVAVAGTRAVPVNMLGTLSTFTVEDYIRIQEEKRYRYFYNGEQVTFRDLFPDYRPKSDVHYPLDTIPLKETRELDPAESRRITEFRHDFIARHCDVPREKVSFFDHHACHAYYAYYAANFRDAPVTCLTLDGGGDGVYDSVNVFGADGAYRRIHSSHECLIGKMYSFITLLLRMRPAEEEYKVMGLAPYAKEHKKRHTREALIDYMTLDGIRFQRNPAVEDLYFHTRELLKGERFDGMAGGLQDFAEHFLTRWVDAAIAEVGSGKVVFGGGVAQNVKANKLIAESDRVETFFVPPGPGDESLSIGAAWALMDALDPAGGHRAHIAPLDNGYLGPGFSAADIDAFLDHPRVRGAYKVREGDPDELAAEALMEDGIVAICRGPMEFGPRALGHRSIIANPANPGMVEKINEAVKGRDFWMPFAPSVLAERLDEYLVDNPKAELSYMTACLDSRPEGRRHIVAGLHPRDQTARVHAVRAEAAPDYHYLLTRFHARSGHAGVLNTSLNIHGKPIVLKPTDIAEELLSADRVALDHVLVGDHFLSKSA